MGEAGRLAGDDADAGAAVAAARDLLDAPVVEPGRRRALVLGVDLGELAARPHRRRQHPFEDVVVDHPGHATEIAFRRLATALRHEALDVDDDAHDLADGHEAAVVRRRHGEREAAAVDLREHRFGDHLGADR